MPDPVILILGAGPNVGLSVARKFAAENWKVAAVARTIKDEVKQTAHQVLVADFTDSEGISKIFGEVEAKLGIPNVVVYNAYSLAGMANDGAHPFSISVSSFAKDLAVNTTSLYAALSAAVAGFRKLPPTAPTAFIYTGNMQNTLIVPGTFSLGAGKNASAYLIETAANVYGAKHQFYYADERLPNGDPVMMTLDGDTHADFYWYLAGRTTQGPWDATFVKGVGYKKFEAERDRAVASVATLIANTQ